MIFITISSKLNMVKKQFCCFLILILYVTLFRQKTFMKIYLNIENFFDNSDYPESSKFFFKDNKKVIGKFKDEAAGKIITEFAGAKPKMYSYKTETKESKTAKGVKKSVIRKEIKHQHYLDCLFNNQIMKHKMNTIRSECHQVSSYQINKTSLSCYDDKRYILDDGISSLGYGHFSIDKKIDRL